MKTFEVWDNANPETKETYPYEVVEIEEDGSNTLALFVNERDAWAFVAFKEDE